MRTQWIVSILSLLVSMGLLMIIVGQRQVLMLLQKGSDKLQLDLQKIDHQLTNEAFFKIPLEKLVEQGEKMVKELEVTMTKLGPEVEGKKKEDESCQGDKKKINDELAAAQKTHTETEATLKSESEAWNKEIETLKAQLTEYRPICNHVKAGTLAVKLCGNNTTVTASVTVKKP